MCRARACAAAAPLVLLLAGVASCSSTDSSDYSTDYSTDSSDYGTSDTEDDDPSATVPGVDYGDSLEADFEYCKDFGRTYEDQGSGSAEEGYNVCLDMLDRLDG